MGENGLDVKVATNTKAIKTLEDETEKQWKAIERLQNRLPVWATMLFSILTFAIGCIMTYAVMLRNAVK